MLPMTFPSLLTSGSIVAEIKFCAPGSKNASKQIQEHFLSRFRVADNSHLLPV